MKNLKELIINVYTSVAHNITKLTLSAIYIILLIFGILLFKNFLNNTPLNCISVFIVVCKMIKLFRIILNNVKLFKFFKE